MDSEPPEAETELEEPEHKGFLSDLEPRARRLLVFVGIGALVVGLLGGFAAGFKVEQNRVSDSKSKSAAKPKVAKAKKIRRIAGVVTTAASDSVTVTDPQGFHVKIAKPSTLVVKKTAKGSVADVKVGGSILLRGKKTGTGQNDAAEIIVVPTGSKFAGLKVTKVEGNKITVLQASKKPLTVNVVPTSTISTLGASSAAQIAKGATILANGSGLQGHDTFNATEVIILPPASAFASS